MTPHATEDITSITKKTIEIDLYENYLEFNLDFDYKIPKMTITEIKADGQEELGNIENVDYKKRQFVVIKKEHIITILRLTEPEYFPSGDNLEIFNTVYTNIISIITAKEDYQLTGTYKEVKEAYQILKDFYLN